MYINYFLKMYKYTINFFLFIDFSRIVSASKPRAATDQMYRSICRVLHLDSKVTKGRKKLFYVCEVNVDYRLANFIILKTEILEIALEIFYYFRLKQLLIQNQKYLGWNKHTITYNISYELIIYFLVYFHKIYLCTPRSIIIKIKTLNKIKYSLGNQNIKQFIHCINNAPNNLNQPLKMRFSKNSFLLHIYTILKKPLLNCKLC
jgi:hypothetical protein